MNKRGQFYIILIVIFAFAIYGITSKPNSITEAILFEDFSKISNNYVMETEQTINYAIYNDKDVSEEVRAFTLSFLKYAKQRNPSVGILYIYSNGTDFVEVKNYLTETAEVSNQTNLSGAGEDLIEEVVVTIGGKEFMHQVPVQLENFGEAWYTAYMPLDEFNISVAGIIHNFDLTENIPEFKVILKSKGGADIETVLGGNINIPPDIRFSMPAYESVQVYVKQ